MDNLKTNARPIGGLILLVFAAYGALWIFNSILAAAFGHIFLALLELTGLTALVASPVILVLVISSAFKKRPTP